MIVVSGSNSVELSKYIATELNFTFVKADIRKFSDQEIFVNINYNLHNQEIIIIQSTTKPANDNLIELLLLIDAAKKMQPKQINVLIPYFGYARGDNDDNSTAKFIAEMIIFAGANKIISLDLHKTNKKLINLDSYGVFSPYINILEESIIVAPDRGAIERSDVFSKNLNMNLAVIEKKRNVQNEPYAIRITGDVENKNCIIVDDIVDSGKTICNAAKLLHDKGASSIIACVSHAVLSDGSIELIANSKINCLYVTDSILCRNSSDKIRVVPIKDFLVKWIKEYF